MRNFEIDLDSTMVELIRTLVKIAYDRAIASERHPIWMRKCPKLSDIDFFVACIIKTFSKVDSGRDFLQHYRQVYKVDLCHSTWFTECSNPRRIMMLEALSPFLQQAIKKHMDALGNNYLANLPGVAKANINAYDGHFMRRSVHSVSTKSNETKKPTAGFLFGIDLSCGLIEPLRVVSDGSCTESEIPHFKEWYTKCFVNRQTDGMRITIYDRAMSEFKFWQGEAKHERYVVTRSKTSFQFDSKKALKWDKENAVNQGVLSDEMNTKKINGRNSKFRVIKYYDPVHKQTYFFMTTLPRSIEPGVIAELYRRRWQIEKVFDNTKNDLKELQGWGKSRESLNVQMHATAATYNLIRLFHEMNIVDNKNGTHQSQIKHEKHCVDLQDQLKAEGLKLNPLFLIGHLMRLSCNTIRSVQNFLINKDPVSALFSALSEEIRQ